MAAHIEWHPDTCGCVLLVDKATFSRVSETDGGATTRRCPAHAHLTDPAQLFQQVFSHENRLRSRVLEALRARHPAAFQQFVMIGDRAVTVTAASEPILAALGVTPAEYQTRLKPGVDVSISPTDRTIEVTLPGVSGTVRRSIADAVLAQYGRAIRVL